MKIKLKDITKLTLLRYGVLAGLMFLVPASIMNLTYFWFLAFVAIIVFIWYKILRKLWYKLNDNDPKDNWDYLVYDLIYILGLPIIFNIVMFKVGRNLFNEPLYFYAYYIIVGVIVVMKLLLMASVTKHYYIFRFAITILFVLGNAIIVNQIMNMWYGINFLGQGF
jgi:hypothetical protein